MIPRRHFLALSTGALVLGCGGLPGMVDGAMGPAPTDFALRPTVPGLRDVGAWTGQGAGPVLIQFNLNINDFMRPTLEAAAVARWLDLYESRGLLPFELSFTGHVLTALVDQAPELIARIRALQPTITQHYRILRYLRLESTERELYHTDPATLQIDRSRPGPCLLIQQTFGVTPRDEGGALGALLRARWIEGEQTEALRSLGFDRLQRQDQIGHPDRVIAMALPDPSARDPHEHVEAYLRLRRLERSLLDGGGGNSSADLDDLYRWAQWAHEQGFDLAAIPGLSSLVDLSGLPDFVAGIATLHAPDASRAAWERRLADDPGAPTALVDALRELARRTSTLPTIQAEVAFKLSRLPADRVHVSRLAWHASNDYTAEGWSEHMQGAKGQRPLPLTPAGVRDSTQQGAIHAAVAGMLDALVGSGRVQAASMQHDSQRAQVNSPSVQYPDVLGVDFDRVPGSLSIEDIDARAQAEGTRVKEPGRRPPRRR